MRGSRFCGWLLAVAGLAAAVMGASNDGVTSTGRLAAAAQAAASVYAATPATAQPTPSPQTAAALRASGMRDPKHPWQVGFAKELLDPTAAQIAAGFTWAATASGRPGSRRAR